MNTASRMILAKQLFYCAKMILDAEQLKEGKVIMGKLSDKTRKLIKQYDENGFYDIALKNGMIEEKCVIHHMYGSTTKHWIATDSIDGQQSRDIINQMELALQITSSNQSIKEKAEQEIPDNEKEKFVAIGNSIRDEIDACILIPRTFHDWLNGNLKSNEISIKMKGKVYPLSGRQDYYKFLRKFASDKAKLKKVTKIKYDDKTLISAIHSLYRLASFISL